ncbi:D-aminoacyl-tRNA deacylase [Ammoniphilus sp. 3BR4]|uniref:D-aminoacyl-tRNA deacylase n=1 Tax=Ammoniphilus sp. 3BR4 TaxID=3158265 RepID=UPI0034668E0F
MRVVVQRSKEAQVTVEGRLAGSIECGLVVLVGITHEDTEEDVRFLAEKVANLRIFEDDSGKMNHSLLDIRGSILSVSQFTLYGDCRKGRRPNFMAAARPDHAERLYELFNEQLRQMDVPVETGVFGAMMQVSLVNDGPVTLIIDSKS